jgi:hypothetical protein
MREGSELSQAQTAFSPTSSSPHVGQIFIAVPSFGAVGALEGAESDIVSVWLSGSANRDLAGMLSQAQLACSPASSCPHFGQDKAVSALADNVSTGFSCFSSIRCWGLKTVNSNMPQPAQM